MVNSPGPHSTSTESRILEAAKKVFILRGLEGTSMQQIADEAGIHKSLLHYYFRTKEKLFDAVFSYAFQFIVPQMEGILKSENHINTKIERIVVEYMDLLAENRFIPAFILHEINRNPDRIYKIMQNTGIKPEMFVNQFVNEIQQGNIRPIDPRQLIINILAMCIFPVVARPLIQRIFFGNDENAFRQFLEERKKVVSEFIIQSIKP
jgi:AcrR family transcriptional regulator